MIVKATGRSGQTVYLAKLPESKCVVMDSRKDKAIDLTDEQAATFLPRIKIVYPDAVTISFS